MPDTATTGEQPNDALVELWERKDVLAYFGGKRPLHTSTLYRGIHEGRYPRPIHVSRSHVRWLRSECEAALGRMIAARDEPKPPKKRGRKRRSISP